MQKRHFIAIAGAIRELRQCGCLDHGAGESVAEHIVSAISPFGREFDRDRFTLACRPCEAKR